MNSLAPCIITVGLLLSLPGCSSDTMPRDITKEPLSFLQSGKVNEEDLLFRFGGPTGCFEGERILTWRLGWADAGELGPVPRCVMLTGSVDDVNDAWQGALYNLVVILDDHHVLERFRLIPVRRAYSQVF